MDASIADAPIRVYELGSTVGGLKKGVLPKEIAYRQDIADKLSKIDPGKIYCITHMSDLDGISSAALFYKFFSLPLGNIYFSDYNVDTINGIAEAVEALGLHGAAIIISDFSTNLANTTVIEDFLSKQKSRGNLLLWLDHHPWTEEAITALMRLLDFGVVGENNAYCATEIIYKVLCEAKDADDIGKSIADKAHVADFNLAPPPPPGDTSPNTALAISYYTHQDKEAMYEGLRSLVKDVANLDYESETFTKASDMYRRIAEKEFENLKKNMKVIDSNGIKTVIGFGKFMHATSTCDILHRLTNADMVIYVRTEENSVSMRSWGDVDCSKIAFKMQGGGHPHAAAFRLDDYGDLSSPDLQAKVIDMISSMIPLSVSNDSPKSRRLSVQ